MALLGFGQWPLWKPEVTANKRKRGKNLYVQKGIHTKG